MRLRIRVIRVRRLTQVTEIQPEDITCKLPKRSGGAASRGAAPIVPRVNEGELRVFLGLAADRSALHGPLEAGWQEAIMPGKPLAVLLDERNEEGQRQIFYTTPLRTVRGIELREGPDGEKRPDLIRTQGTEYRIEWV